jgi:hypothetical protein
VRGIEASPPRVADRGCIQYLKGKFDTHATLSAKHNNSYLGESGNL